MELSSKLLREVEFRDRLRGYDTDEVDEFLEQVAVGVDELRAQLEAARSAPPVATAAPAAIEDDDSIRRTLVLAQRTADLAIAEAKSEAEQLVREARAEAERVTSEAAAAASTMRSEAEIELTERVARLGAEREQLEAQIAALTELVDGERRKLSSAIDGLASQLSSLQVSDGFRAAAVRPAPSPLLVEEPEPVVGGMPEHDFDLTLTIPERPAAPQPRATEATTGQVTAAEPSGIDEALWERWANSAEDDREDDPFRSGA
jgi:DivIVA domain-containing protein